MSDDLLANVTGNDWDEFYAQPGTEIQQLIDQSICGCEYDGSSWTNAAEALELAALMKLDVDSHLLDIGSGAGWPALFQASNTGCRITLTDISGEGLKAAAQKASDGGLGDRCETILTGAEKLPFASGHFDAIGHADVLCCLEEKLEALGECRRVIRDGGIMAFSVIHMRPGASDEETREAADAGPSLLGAPADYPAMLEQTGWNIEAYSDITAGYAGILENLQQQYELNAAEICAQRSEERYREFLAKCQAKRKVVTQSSVLRSLFTVTPA